jgi:hypothetical protein
MFFISSSPSAPRLNSSTAAAGLERHREALVPRMTGVVLEPLVDLRRKRHCERDDEI